jgi:hypothetical protein
MKKQPKYSPEVIERAARMVTEPASEYSSRWGAVESIEAKIGYACILADLKSTATKP